MGLTSQKYIITFVISFALARNDGLIVKALEFQMKLSET